MTTKRDIINGAFEELGLGSYVYDATPEDYSSALSRLNGMMAEWNSYGVPTGYPMSSSTDVSTLDDQTGIIQPIVEGVKMGLAVRIAPSYGKTPSPATNIAAQRGWNVALRLIGAPPHKRQNTASAPAGAGYKIRTYNRALPPDGPREITPEGKIRQ